MIRRTVLSFMTLAIGTAPALADQMSACRKNSSPDAQAAACSEVIDQKPGADILANAWTYRGKAYARKGMASEAAANYSEAIRIKPSLSAAWIGRGMARVIERRFDDAIADFSTAIGLSPNDASMYVARGYAFLVKNKPNQAITDFSTALQFNRTNPIALNNRGLAYRKLGQNDRALMDFTTAVRPTITVAILTKRLAKRTPPLKTSEMR